MTLEEFREHISRAAHQGTLMTSKHDSGQLHTPFSSFRTVLTYELAANLESFIDSGQYSVQEYENSRFPNTPEYFVVTPDLNSGYDIGASGVPAGSLFGTTLADRLVVVRGQTMGMHIFGEHSSQIESKLETGELREIRVLQ